MHNVLFFINGHVHGCRFSRDCPAASEKLFTALLLTLHIPECTRRSYNTLSKPVITKLCSRESSFIFSTGKMTYTGVVLKSCTRAVFPTHGIQKLSWSTGISIIANLSLKVTSSQTNFQGERKTFLAMGEKVTSLELKHHLHLKELPKTKVKKKIPKCIKFIKT